MFYSQLRPQGPGQLQAPGLTADKDELWIKAILVGTVSYQAFLCFINTHGVGVSRALLGASEAVILLACLPIMARRILPGVLVLATFAGAMFCFLSLASGQLNIKTFRDLGGHCGRRGVEFHRRWAASASAAPACKSADAGVDELF